MSELTDFSASAVVVGSLNPLIFSPEWLHAVGAIGPEESAAAREKGIEVMAPNVSSIEFNSMKLVVEQAKFTLIVSDEPLIRVKDFTATCFRLLSHTPVMLMGLNFTATLREADMEKWHRFGDVLAPKGPWKDFLSDEDGQRTGGLRTMVMDKRGAPGGRRGHVRCILQVVEGVAGQATVEINNHFILSTDKGPSDGAEVFKIVQSEWEDIFEASRRLISNVGEVADAA